MAVIRVNKTANYTVMSNTHFKEREMSLKAKGLLSLMLSLPDNWDYSINGLATLCKDGRDSIMKTLNELEDFGYLTRTRATNDKGQFTGYQYDIFESPQQEKPYTENPCTENPYTDKPNTENPQQLNTNKLNNKELNTLLINNQSINHKEEKKIDRLIDVDTINDIKEQIEYNILSQDFDGDLLDTAVSCIADLYTVSDPQTFNNRTYSVEFIQKRSLEINSEHIRYVFECFEEQREKVFNVRKYLLTAIFNAPDTMGAYYENAVRAAGFI